MRNSQTNMIQVPTPLAIGPWQSAYGRWPMRLAETPRQVCRSSNQRKTSAKESTQRQASELSLVNWYGKNVVVKGDLRRIVGFGILGRKLKSAKCSRPFGLAMGIGLKSNFRRTFNTHTCACGNANRTIRPVSLYIKSVLMCACSCIERASQITICQKLRRQAAAGKEFWCIDHAK